MEIQNIKDKKCAWCSRIIQNSSEIINVTVKAKDDIEYGSGQYITKIILLNSKEEIPSFTHFEDYGNETRYKEIPVFIIPFRDDEKDIAIITCSYECAEKIKTAFQSEDYVYEWNFS